MGARYSGYAREKGEPATPPRMADWFTAMAWRRALQLNEMIGGDSSSAVNRLFMYYLWCVTYKVGERHLAERGVSPSR